MRVHLERSYTSMTTRVFVTRQTRDTTELMQLDYDPSKFLVSWERMDPGTHPSAVKPTLELPDDVLQALAAAAMDVMPPDRAQGAHLADAVAVRDRLLALIERTTP